jgi:hypothetical protein
MEPRVTRCRRAVLLGSATLVGELAAQAESAKSEPLFVIARSKNANIVEYDARWRAGGRLDPDEPLVAYWIMRAENGRRESLTWLERRLAYGFDTRFEAGGDVLAVRLRAFATRGLRVRRGTQGRFQAEMTIGRQPSVLERIFVCTDEGGVTPSVRYVELAGRALASRARVSERIVP